MKKPKPPKLPKQDKKPVFSVVRGTLVFDGQTRLTRKKQITPLLLG